MVKYTLQQVKALKNNERLAQKQVFETLYAGLFRVCQRYIVQHDEAEDCLMKGFMKAFQQIDRFEYRDEDSFYWWMRRVVINECLMSLRKKHNFRMTVEEEWIEAPVDAEAFIQADAEHLNHLITTLPTGYRTVFSLHVIEGYEHGEIAEMLGISESTSKTQLAKSKNRLRQMLGQNNRMYGNAGK